MLDFCEIQMDRMLTRIRPFHAGRSIRICTIDGLRGAKFPLAGRGRFLSFRTRNSRAEPGSINPNPGDHQLRTLTIAAFLALTAAAAQAGESLDARIHDAAVAACAPESADSLPASHYGAITQTCVTRISNLAKARYEADAEAKTKASTAALANN